MGGFGRSTRIHSEPGCRTIRCFAAVIAARLGVEDVVTQQAPQVTARQSVGKSERDEAHAEAAGGDPAQGPSHVRLPHLPG